MDAGQECGVRVDLSNQPTLIAGAKTTRSEYNIMEFDLILCIKLFRLLDSQVRYDETVYISRFFINSVF